MASPCAARRSRLTAPDALPRGLAVAASPARRGLASLPSWIAPGVSRGASCWPLPSGSSVRPHACPPVALRPAQGAIARDPVRRHRPSPACAPVPSVPQPVSPAEDWRPADSSASSNELLTTLSRVQAQFISGPGRRHVFEGLLDDLLVLTDSAFGFIGEVHDAARAGPLRRIPGDASHLVDAASPRRRRRRATYSELIPLVKPGHGDRAAAGASRPSTSQAQQGAAAASPACRSPAALVWWASSVSASVRTGTSPRTDRVPATRDGLDDDAAGGREGARSSARPRTNGCARAKSGTATCSSTPATSSTACGRTGRSRT